MDINGGPGSHFTEIRDAVAAAADGDVLVVKPGLYQQFSLDKGLAILAEPGAAAHAVVRIQDLGPDQQALVCGLQIVTLHVTQNQGPVLLQGLAVHPDPGLIPFSSAEHVRVDACADVRMSASATVSPGGVKGMEAVNVFDARLELAQCQLRAQRGADEGPAAATGGGQGLLLGAGARVHAALSGIEGGAGGAAAAGSGQIAGDGGDGARLIAGSTLIAAGTAAHALRGGAGGDAPDCAFAGFGGNGVTALLGAGGRIGVALERGGSACPGHEGLAFSDPGGGLSFPAPADPTLDARWQSSAQNVAVFDVLAPPSTDVKLYLGRRPVVVPIPGVVIEQLCTQDRLIDLGSSGATGAIQKLVPVPPSLPQGFALMAQAEIFDPSTGETWRTNSAFVVKK